MFIDFINEFLEDLLSNLDRFWLDKTDPWPFKCYQGGISVIRDLNLELD